MLQLFASRLKIMIRIDSPRYYAFRERKRGLGTDEMQSLASDPMRTLFHVHGTHIAGVAIRGELFVRMVSVADSSMGAGVSVLSDPIA